MAYFNKIIDNHTMGAGEPTKPAPQREPEIRVRIVFNGNMVTQIPSDTSLEGTCQQVRGYKLRIELT